MVVASGYVVVGIDASESGAEALDWASQEASYRGVPLVLVHAVDRYPVDWPDQSGLADKVREAGQALLVARRDDVYDVHPELEVRLELSTSSSTEALLNLAEDASLVVVGSRHRGAVSRLFLGSTSHTLATRCPVPVAVVRQRPDDPDAPVAVGVDGTEVSAQALRYAFLRAQERKAPLHAVMAWQPADVPVGFGIYRVDTQILPEIKAAAERQLAESLASPLEDYPDVEVRRTVAQGDATTVLVSAAAGAQMLVVGSHRHGAVARVVLGSVSSNLLHAVPTPLVIVRAS